MKCLFRNILVILGCLHMLGGPHSIIQIYAWTNMLATYSQQSSFSKAVVDTFSGKKPCALCDKISASKELHHDEKEKDFPWSPKSPKFFPELMISAITELADPRFHIIAGHKFAADVISCLVLNDKPLTPPPRA